MASDVPSQYIKLGKGGMMSICLISSDVNHDPLGKVVSARYLHCKVNIFPFVVNKHGGRVL